MAEAINFAFLYWLCKRKKFEGQIIALFMIVYGIERFIFEFFRGDPGRGEVLGGLISRNAGDRAGTGGEWICDLPAADALLRAASPAGGSEDEQRRRRRGRRRLQVSEFQGQFKVKGNTKPKANQAASTPHIRQGRRMGHPAGHPAKSTAP